MRTILCDCDGVIADFAGACLELIEAATGVPRTKEEIKEHDIFGSLGLKHMKHILDSAVERGGWCLGIKPYNDAKCGIDMLRSHGEFIIVTSPMHARHWMYERTVWLEQYFNIPSEKVIFAREKQHIVGDVFIDDNYTNVVNWSKRFPAGLAVLYGDHKYNEEHNDFGNIKRAKTWKEVEELLELSRLHTDC